jgi:flagellar biosynthesis/type III secretory pathway protein FliH
LLVSFDSYRDKIFAANETFLMDLIAEVGGMIVLKEVAIDRDYIRRLVTTLLQQLGTKDDIKIYLAEADYENVETLREAIEKEFGKLNNSTIEISHEIPVGGCKIETRFGVVDASIAAQIENVKRALKG